MCGSVIDLDYIIVAAEDELWDGEMEPYHVDGKDLLLVKLDGEYFVYDDACPHQGTPLTEGELTGATLTCRAHEWVFDARTGAGINPAGARLRRHEIRIADGCIWVRRSHQDRGAA
jgi:nitrite reductase/ring-hydroxylating ferredoxin subunit